MTAEFSGEEPVISFNPAFLLDGLTAAAAGTAGPGGGAGAAPAGDGQAAHADGEPSDGGADAGTGRIRLEFNSPAKPALITWTSDHERDGVPAFRYLLVPLRVPERS